MLQDLGSDNLLNLITVPLFLLYNEITIVLPSISRKLVEMILLLVSIHNDLLQKSNPLIIFLCCYAFNLFSTKYGQIFCSFPQPGGFLNRKKQLRRDTTVLLPLKKVMKSDRRTSPASWHASFVIAKATAKAKARHKTCSFSLLYPIPNQSIKFFDLSLVLLLPLLPNFPTSPFTGSRHPLFQQPAIKLFRFSKDFV